MILERGFEMRAMIILIPLMIGLLLIPATISASDSDTTIEVVPARVEVSASEEFSIEIVIDPDGANVYSGQYTLSFDPGVLEALSQEEGDLLNEAGAVNTIEVTNSIDNDAGKLEYGLTRMGVATGVTTTGTLSRVAFKVIGEARGSYLDFTDVVVGDTSAKEIPVLTENGVCLVGGVAPISTPEPTITTTEEDTHAPTVTATATATATTTVTPEAEVELEVISEETVIPVSTPTTKEMKSMPVSTSAENAPGFGAIVACTGILIISCSLRRRFR